MLRKSDGAGGILRTDRREPQSHPDSPTSELVEHVPSFPAGGDMSLWPLVESHGREACVTGAKIRCSLKISHSTETSSWTLSDVTRE